MTAAPMRLSNAKIKTWRRCPKQYEFKYVRKLRPKARKFPLALGSWIHELLMVHYDGEDWKQRHRENLKAFNKLFEEEKEDLGNLPSEAARLMISYLHYYRNIDKHLHTVDSELDEIITLPNGLDFNFIIDRIYEDREGGLWLQDHKSVSSFMDTDFMLLDAQLTRYFWCAEKMGYTPLMGIEFNELRTKAPTIPPLTKKGKISTAKKYDTDYVTFYRAVRKYGLDPKDYTAQLDRLRGQTDKFFRRSQLPRDKPMTRQMMAEMMMSAREIRSAERREEFPRTPDKSCTWGCDFLEPCTIQLMGGDLTNVLKLKYTTKGERKDR